MQTTCKRGRMGLMQVNCILTHIPIFQYGRNTHTSTHTVRIFRNSQYLPLIAAAEMSRISLAAHLRTLGYSLRQYHSIRRSQVSLRAWQRDGCPPRPVRKDKGGKHKPGGGRPRKKPENKSPI